MLSSLEIFAKIISSLPFILTVECISFTLKACLLVFVILHGLRSPKVQRSWFYLIFVLIGAMFDSTSWIALSLNKVLWPTLKAKYVIFVIRIAWAWTVIQYQSLSLFIESLIEKHHTIRWYQKIFIGISSLLSLSLLYVAFFEFNNVDNRSTFECNLFKIVSLFTFIVMVPSLYAALHKIRSNTLPKILNKQIKILIQVLVGPLLFSDFIQYYPFSFFTGYIVSNYTAVSISTILLTFTLYFCAKKMMGLRFLNFYSHVQSSPNSFNFIDDFKEVLEQLGQASTLKELSHIAQAFFKAAFTIQPSRTTLYVRKFRTSLVSEHGEHDDPIEISSIETTVENFIIRHDPTLYTCQVTEFLRRIKILITDEIAFTDFYDETASTKETVQFLHQINADIFLPIFERNTIIAYIVVERNARDNEFYTNIERDEMVVFASYLSNIINLLQNRSLSSIIQKDKEIQEELYKKHQEINQYKESIRSFLRDTRQRKIGILFYKNRQFIYGNQSAKELIALNLNALEGHPLTKELKKLVKHVEEYKSTQTSFTKDCQGNRLVLSALPNLEHNNIIITVYYPEISDIIKEQIDLLQNPTEWDYLLYLETTKTGNLIKQLIPGSGEHLLNFKISLLKTALSKKALLLEMHEDDLMSTVELLHHVSMRGKLHVLTLQAPEQNFEIAIKLFGMNPIFNATTEPALLEKLNAIGTLFIQNIHFLDLETQQYLAEFIRYGHYHLFKSDQKIASNVRIICSTNQDIKTLVQKNKFSKALYHELEQTTISLPSLLSLPKKELSDLADGFTQQSLSTQAFANLLQLTDKEKNRLIDTSSASVQEFKKKVQYLLATKSKKNEIHHETLFDPAYNISDPELIHAARLGKKALKDPKIVAMLIHKFKNQNQIASFLGVNRSSVNRRCKEYNLE